MGHEAGEKKINKQVIDEIERNMLRAVKIRRILINLFFLLLFSFLGVTVKTTFEATAICLLGILYLSIRQLSAELNLHYGTEDLRTFQRFKQLSRTLNIDMAEYMKASRETEFKKIAYINEANLAFKLNFCFDIIFLIMLIGNIFRLILR